MDLEIGIEVVYIKKVIHIMKSLLLKLILEN